MALTQTETEIQKRLDLVVPKASGTGIKVDETTPTYPWRDITADITVRGAIGGTSPSFTAYRGTVYQYEFNSTGEESFQVFHMPHDWVAGTDIHIHAHWSHNSASVTTGAVTWGFDVSWAKGFDQEAFSAPITATVAQNASTTQYQHMVAEVQLTASTPTASQIDTDLVEVDGLFLVRTYLSANTMDGSAHPFLHTVDLHYQSSNIGTKAKAPNFYT